MCYGHCLLVRLSRCVVISCGSAMLTFVHVGAIHLIVGEHAQAGVISDDWVAILPNFCLFQMSEASAPCARAILVTSVAPFSVAPFSSPFIVVKGGDFFYISFSCVFRLH